MIEWIDIKKIWPPEPNIYLIAVTIPLEDRTGLYSKSFTTANFNGNYFSDDITGMGIANVTHWSEVPDNYDEECPPYIPLDARITGMVGL